MSITLFGALAVVPAVQLALRVLRVLPTPYVDSIIKARVTAVMEGDFVVFILGARLNDAFPSSTAREVGQAFSAMLKPLDTSDPSVGFLGGDGYVGAHPGRSTTCNIMYWRSYEHLHAWARSPAAKHLAVWSAFNRRGGAEQASCGIWHETYLVQDGQYECIYRAMPPVGLALASGNIQPAVGPMRTSAGRVKGKSVTTLASLPEITNERDDHIPVTMPPGQ